MNIIYNNIGKNENKIDTIDYQIPVTLLRGVRWRWRYAEKRLY